MELIGIIEAFMELKRYLTGEQELVTVYTYHQNLQSFLTKRILNQRIIRLAQELTDYNFKIVYRLRSRGEKPDPLNRQPDYHAEEGASHSQQSILKPKHFQISVVYQKQTTRTDLSSEK